jgi:hypothetical protein
MLMLLVIVLVASGLLLIVDGNGLFGVALIAVAVHLAQHAKGDMVEDLATTMFGLVVIGGTIALAVELLR